MDEAEGEEGLFLALKGLNFLRKVRYSSDKLNNHGIKIKYIMLPREW